MLAGNFYTTTKVSYVDENIAASIRLNPDHTIYLGHFPGQPIMPGVCMIQMVRELAEQITERRFMILQGDNIKFLSVLNPFEITDIEATIQLKKKENKYVVQATLFAGAVVFFKFSGIFQEV